MVYILLLLPLIASGKISGIPQTFCIAVHFVFRSQYNLKEGDQNATHIEGSYAPLRYVSVVVADLDRFAWHQPEQWFTPTGTVIHYNYDPRWYWSDIPLIYITPCAHENLGLEPIELPVVG